MNQYLHKERLIVVLTLLVLALPLVAGGLYVYRKHEWAVQRLAELEPRYARLIGIEGSSEALSAASDQAAAMLQQYVYPADKELSPAGNDAQQKVRDVFSAAGLQVGSSQVVAPKLEAGFDRIQLSVRAEGELASLQAALIGLAGLQPAVFVDTMTASVMGTATADKHAKLAIQFGLSALRVHP